MNQDQWGDVLEKIKSKFTLEEQTKVALEDIPNGTEETVIFQSPLGRFKILFTVKPKVLSQKNMYSNRAGGQTQVQYEYSETEMTSGMRIFKWDDFSGDWKPAKWEL